MIKKSLSFVLSLMLLSFANSYSIVLMPLKIINNTDSRIKVNFIAGSRSYETNSNFPNLNNNLNKNSSQFKGMTNAVCSNSGEKKEEIRPKGTVLFSIDYCNITEFYVEGLSGSLNGKSANMDEKDLASLRFGSQVNIKEENGEFKFELN